MENWVLRKLYRHTPTQDPIASEQQNWDSNPGFWYQAWTLSALLSSFMWELKCLHWFGVWRQTDRRQSVSSYTSARATWTIYWLILHVSFFFFFGISYITCILLIFLFYSMRNCCCSVAKLYPTLTPWIAAPQVPLPSTIFWSLLNFMTIESVMLSNYLILFCPFLLLPSILPCVRVFSSKSALCISWPKYWSFSFSSSPSCEYSGLISFRIDCIFTQSNDG